MEKLMYRLPEGISARLFDSMKGLPVVREAIEKEMDGMMADIKQSVKPYTGEVEQFAALPDAGRGKDAVLEIMEHIQTKESEKWKDGFVSGAVYHGDSD